MRASSASLSSLAVAGGVVLAGVLGGLFAVAGGASDGEEEEVEQMLGDLAHDLRGPLTVVNVPKLHTA